MEVHDSSSSQRIRHTAKNLLLIVAMLAVASGLLAACGGSKESVVGAWNAVSTSGTRTDGTLFNRRSTVEFFEDGTLIVEGRSANWSWLAEDNLRIEFSEESYVLETSFEAEKFIVLDRGYGGKAVVTFEPDYSKKRASDQSSNKK